VVFTGVDLFVLDKGLVTRKRWLRHWRFLRRARGDLPGRRRTGQERHRV